MFRLFRLRSENKLFPPIVEPDALNKAATEIAIELIEGQGGTTYLNGMRKVFKNTPSLIEDVDPEYREKLKKVLEKNREM